MNASCPSSTPALKPSSASAVWSGGSPLAASAPYCAVNAEAVLARFTGHNLRLALGGHYHGRTEAVRGDTALVTNACCARVVGNHDGTTAKGYWLCRATATGEVRREFVEFAGAPA